MRRRAPIFVALCLAMACGKGATTNQAPVLPPSNPEAVSKLAQGVEAAKDADGRARAIRLLEEAVKVDGQLWEARYNLGVLYADAGNLAAAERELGEAQKLAPNAEDVAVALAVVRGRRGDPDGGVAALEDFVKRHPDASVAPVVLMAGLREAERVDDAIDLAHTTLVRRSRDPYALSELALSHLAREEIDTAQILGKEAQKADPKSAVAERTLGLIALENGDDAEAFAHFARSAELDPTDTTSRLNIGTVLLYAGVYDRAVVEFKAVRDADPNDVPAALGLAAALRGRAKKDDAATFTEVEKLLKEVLDREPGNLSATYNLAVLYADHLKRPTEATPLYTRFLEDAPKTHPARPQVEAWLSSQKK